MRDESGMNEALKGDEDSPRTPIIIDSEWLLGVRLDMWGMRKRKKTCWFEWGFIRKLQQLWQPLFTIHWHLLNECKVLPSLSLPSMCSSPPMNHGATHGITGWGGSRKQGGGTRHWRGSNHTQDVVKDASVNICIYSSYFQFAEHSLAGWPAYYLKKCIHSRILRYDYLMWVLFELTKTRRVHLYNDVK